MERIKRFFKKEEGVTVIEYAVIASLIIVACIVVIGLVGGQVQAVFEAIRVALGGAAA